MSLTLQILVALGPTLLVIIGGLISWYLKEKSEKYKLHREKLIEEKRSNYIKILEPSIRALAGIRNVKDQKIANELITSFNYQKTVFELMMFGSDDVIKAFNNLQQYVYKNTNSINSKILLEKLGSVVLEVRKDLGNKNTKLEPLDMLQAVVRDINNL